MQRIRTVMAWSGGKDSAMALHALRGDTRYEVVGLMTTVAQRYDRVSHHGIRSELIDRQAERIGLPLKKLYLTDEGCCSCINQRYEDLMRDAMLAYKKQGVEAVAFGDIFLEDLRRRREEKLALVDMQAVFPIWGRDTRQLVRDFVTEGFQAIVSCVVTDKLDPSFAGRQIDQAFISDLPTTVDPCGENGEYHSYVWDGPIYSRPIEVRTGHMVHRDVRCFVELLPDKDSHRRDEGNPTLLTRHLQQS